MEVEQSSDFTLWALADADPFLPNALVQFDYSYDAAGNLLSAAENAAESLASGLGSVTLNAYDELNRLQQTKQTATDGTTVNRRADYAYRLDGSRESVARYSNDGATLVAAKAGKGDITEIDRIGNDNE